MQQEDTSANQQNNAVADSTPKINRKSVHFENTTPVKDEITPKFVLPGRIRTVSSPFIQLTPEFQQAYQAQELSSFKTPPPPIFCPSPHNNSIPKPPQAILRSLSVPKWSVETIVRELEEEKSPLVLKDDGAYSSDGDQNDHPNALLHDNVFDNITPKRKPQQPISPMSAHQLKRRSFNFEINETNEWLEQKLKWVKQQTDQDIKGFLFDLDQLHILHADVNVAQVEELRAVAEHIASSTIEELKSGEYKVIMQNLDNFSDQQGHTEIVQKYIRRLVFIFSRCSRLLEYLRVSSSESPNTFSAKQQPLHNSSMISPTPVSLKLPQDKMPN